MPKKSQSSRCQSRSRVDDDPKKKKTKSSKKLLSAPTEAKQNVSVTVAADPSSGVKRKRARITLENYVEKIQSAIQKCDTEINRLSANPTGERKGIKTLKSVRRTLLELETKAPKLTKLRRRYNMTGKDRKNSGLTTPQKISDELRAFLKVDKNQSLSRIEVTRAINSYIHLKENEDRPNILVWNHLNLHNRNLQNPDDKRIIFPDESLAALLRYPQYQKDVAAKKITEQHKNKLTGTKERVSVTSDALHYRTVQKLIQIHYS